MGTYVLTVQSLKTKNRFSTLLLHHPMGCWVILLVQSLLQLCNPVLGHGNMVFPYAWWDVNQVGSQWNENGGNTNIGCGVLDLPEETEFFEARHHPPDCMSFWFSNQVRIPGYMAQDNVTCHNGDAGHSGDHPWDAPGTAPIFSPCGNLGGFPNGCKDDGQGKFGDCCSGNCDSFALGKNAEDYVWVNPPETEWKAGSYQEVAWYVSANHAGGYSYRLCKMPQEGISQLTEECFQQNPLEFAGEDQWVQYKADRKTGIRTGMRALQTTEGTFPEGSMWRANQIRPDAGDDYEHGIIFDNIKVPTNLERGEYVLSFRWDSLCSPQVWNSCANIQIV